MTVIRGAITHRPRTRNLQAPVFEEQYEQFHKLAKAQGLSGAELLRRLALAAMRAAGPVRDVLHVQGSSESAE